MPNKCFLIPISAPVKNKGLYAIKSFGDVYVQYDPETMTIELIQYLGVNILPMLTQVDPSLEYFYKAMESYIEAMRTEKDVEEENNYADYN